jgi:sulfonate transport system substrate-binding protein
MSYVVRGRKYLASLLLILAIVLSIGVTGYGKESLPVFKVSDDDWTYIAREKGWLDKAFAADGTKVTITEVPSSGTEGALFERGDLHITERMFYPAYVFKTNGYDLSIVDISKHPGPEIVSIIVPTDSPAKSFSDLKGKKIASARTGCASIVLFEMAEKLNWEYNVDFKYYNIPSSEYKAALLAKEIDAISSHPSTNVVTLLLNGLAREIEHPSNDSMYIQGGGVYVNITPTAFARKYPNTIKKYLKIRYQTFDWIKNNQDEAAAIIQRVRRVPPEISKYVWKSRFATWTPEHSYATVVADAERTQDWLINHGDVKPEKRIDIKKFIDKQFFQ